MSFEEISALNADVVRSFHTRYAVAMNSGLSLASGATH